MVPQSLSSLEPSLDSGQMRKQTVRQFLFVKAVPSYVFCRSLSWLVYHFSWLLCYLVMMHCACQKQEQHRVENTVSEMAARSSYGSILFLFFFLFPRNICQQRKNSDRLDILLFCLFFFFFIAFKFFPFTSLCSEAT